VKEINDGSKGTDKKDEVTLSDGQLENAAGGYNSPFVNRWECFICGEHGRWSKSDAYIEIEKGMHCQKTGHNFFGMFCRQFDGPYDPYED
jgi:hypothetical protein